MPGYSYHALEMSLNTWPAYLLYRVCLAHAHPRAHAACTCIALHLYQHFLCTTLVHIGQLHAVHPESSHLAMPAQANAGPSQHALSQALLRSLGQLVEDFQHSSCMLMMLVVAWHAHQCEPGGPCGCLCRPESPLRPIPPAHPTEAAELQGLLTACGHEHAALAQVTQECQNLSSAIDALSAAHFAHRQSLVSAQQLLSAAQAEKKKLVVQQAAERALQDSVAAELNRARQELARTQQEVQRMQVRGELQAEQRQAAREEIAAVERENQQLTALLEHSRPRSASVSREHQALRSPPNIAGAAGSISSGGSSSRAAAPRAHRFTLHGHWQLHGQAHYSGMPTVRVHRSAGVAGSAGRKRVRASAAHDPLQMEPSMFKRWSFHSHSAHGPDPERHPARTAGHRAEQLFGEEPGTCDSLFLNPGGAQAAQHSIA